MELNNEITASISRSNTLPHPCSLAWQRRFSVRSTWKSAKRLLSTERASPRAVLRLLYMGIIAFGWIVYLVIYFFLNRKALFCVYWNFLIDHVGFLFNCLYLSFYLPFSFTKTLLSFFVFLFPTVSLCGEREMMVEDKKIINSVYFIFFLFYSYCFNDVKTEVVNYVYREVVSIPLRKLNCKLIYTWFCQWICKGDRNVRRRERIWEIRSWKDSFICICVNIMSSYLKTKKSDGDNTVHKNVNSRVIFL